MKAVTTLDYDIGDMGWNPLTVDKLDQSILASPLAWTFFHILLRFAVIKKRLSRRVYEMIQYHHVHLQRGSWVSLLLVSHAAAAMKEMTAIEETVGDRVRVRVDLLKHVGASLMTHEYRDLPRTKELSR